MASELRTGRGVAFDGASAQKLESSTARRLMESMESDPGAPNDKTAGTACPFALLALFVVQDPDRDSSLDALRLTLES